MILNELLQWMWIIIFILIAWKNESAIKGLAQKGKTTQERKK